MSQLPAESVDVFQPPASAPAFLIHHEGDHVAVAVQNVTVGERIAVYMDSDRVVTITVTEPIPLGHKVALIDLASGSDVIEYGVRVGIMRAAVTTGSLIHTQNIRSARWQKSV